MPLIGSVWSTALYGNLSGLGMTGSELLTLCNAIGNGSVSHISGKAFITTDTGLTAGAGAGVGTGIVGLVPVTIAASMYSTCVASFGQAGSSLMDLCTAVATVFVAQMATATLTSTHAPVFSGSGIINVGSISVSSSAMKLAILAEAPGFTGANWIDLADAIAGACTSAILSSGTGTVTITGAGAPGTPGGGAGAGTIL